MSEATITEAKFSEAVSAKFSVTDEKEQPQPGGSRG